MSRQFCARHTEQLVEAREVEGVAGMGGFSQDATAESVERGPEPAVCGRLRFFSRWRVSRAKAGALAV